MGWLTTALRRNVLRSPEPELPQVRRGTVVVFIDEESAHFADQLRSTSRSAKILPIDGGTDSEVHAELTGRGPFDLIFDATLDPPANRLARFRRNWFHLGAGGRYCLRRAGAGLPDNPKSETVWQFVARLLDTRDRGGYDDIGWKQHDARKEDKCIAGSIRQVSYTEELLIMTNSAPRMPKLREWEVGRVLQLRPEIGRIVTTKPRQTLTSKCTLRTNHDRLAHRFRDEYQVPEMQLREYTDALCCPHQVVISRDILLPDSFRHITQPRLYNRFLDDAGPLFASYSRSLSAPTKLAGTYFYLSSEWPRHFGHIMTEQLSRMWAWRQAKERYPDLKALLTAPHGRTELVNFEREVLSAAGVPGEDFVSPRGVLQVERLVSATPMLVNPTYVHPELPDLWRRTGAKLIRQAGRRDWPVKVFISRRADLKRACNNLAEVEEFFARHGYTTLYPEDYSVAEQAMIFDSAERIAGFAGSGMFSLMFCANPKPVILIASESYTARNEYMISFALGHRLVLLWCDPDIEQPDRGWNTKAFTSGFSLDFKRDGEFLAEALTADW